MQELIVINGNNIEILKDYPDNYFDSVVTDPPDGLGKEPNAAELMKDWIEHGYHEVSGSGFMGKEWDAFVPQPVFWKEVFRVLKHGGHVLSFFGTRTYDWGVMSMRFAGFEVRDCIQWLYGSGFPKSHNIGKAIDKMQGNQREVKELGRAGKNSKAFNDYEYRIEKEIYSTAGQYEITKGNSEWEGWGSALKPANEPIVLARKPLEKGLSIAENILKWGVGGINIDASRISTNGEKINIGFSGKILDDTNGWNSNNIERTPYDSTQGRFPANIIFTHHPECECIGTKKVKSDGHHSWKIPDDGGLLKLGLKQKEDEGNKYAENGKEEVENWDCHEDCPIRILDEQSGTLNKQGISKTDNKSGWQNSYVGGDGVNAVERKLYLDTGGASRFFYVAKASKSERNKGLEGFEEKRPDIRDAKGMGTFEQKGVAKQSNFHPTVKPVKLMQYLVKMITPPNGIVLDPFCGSGTTGVACKLDGFRFVGMEQDPEYSKIAESRINNYVEENGKAKKNKPKENEEPITTQTTLF